MAEPLQDRLTERESQWESGRESERESGLERGLRSRSLLEDFKLRDSPLSEREQQILALERQWWKYAGAKEQAIRELFDLSATHYYQILNALIDTEHALAHDPMLVKRLRRLRTSRQRARTARRLGSDA
ncbi:DUF3263 domain-containing protein [Arthrobacter sp. FW305-BF8]|uniref:DUF3263 domain-containing protein n=1 Tax=Arthrobacter sp. FW305-BF8 TaxID=2879617 RepID=UPI001F29D6B3|nr:DUF3263 domain-containing protein [Arthrobacter sp. FW305-BF8]UKA55296.1 DUF3263 domain-containing protein [Arthrobacter sp. FW305-BF8]